MVQRLILQGLRLIGEFRRDTAGVMAILVVLMVPVLVGFMGIAVDVGLWYTQKRALQTAADAAAIAGAFEIVNGSSDAIVQATAVSDANRNGCGSCVLGTDITVNIPSSSDSTSPNFNAPGSVEVIITRPMLMLFSQVFFTLRGDNVTTNARVRAVAVPVAGITQRACIVALDPGVQDALVTRSNAIINAAGCAIQVNSTNDLALETFATPPDGVPTITADNICVTGDFNDDGGQGFSTPPLTGAAFCPQLSDPFASVTPPTVGSCDFDGLTITDGDVSGTVNDSSLIQVASTPTDHPDPSNCGGIKKVTLSPRVYCNGLG